MIIKGKSRGNGAQLGAYLVAPGENEQVRVVEIRGVAAPDVPGAVYEMDALSLGTGMTKSLYHAQLNTRAEERLTEVQRTYAIDKLEAALGLTGQPRVVVVHEKKGREHTHVVWARTDLQHMRAISDSFNFRKHEEVARALEREFGHERVQGAHVEREGKERPDRTPSQEEMRQAERTGLTPKEIKAQITELWRRSDSGQAFAMALRDAGYVLARGDRRDFVVIDPKGGIQSLSRRCAGATTRDIRERLADLRDLPTVSEAKQMQRARQEKVVGLDHRPESVRRDEEERSKRHGLDPALTSRGGTVAQQRSTMDWVMKAHDEKKAGPGPSDHRQQPSEASQAAQQRRQALLREFGQELSRKATHNPYHEHERSWR